MQNYGCRRKRLFQIENKKFKMENYGVSRKRLLN